MGGLRNWGPTHLTCKLSICWGGTDSGTHAHRGATVPPSSTVELNFISSILRNLGFEALLRSSGKKVKV